LRNRKILFIILFCALLMISLVSTLLLSGFLSPPSSVLEGMESKSATFEGWLRASRGVETLETSYEAKMVIQTYASTYTVILDKGKAYEKENYSMQQVDVKMPDGGAVTVRTYILGNNVYTCSNVDGKWIPEKTKVIVPLYKGAILKFLEDLYNKGAMGFVEGKKTVGGRVCSQLNITIDVSKLSWMERCFILAFGGLSAVNPDEYAHLIRPFSMSLCVADGVVMEKASILELAEPIKSTVRLYTLVKDYKVNQGIPGDIFIVPPKIEGDEIWYVWDGRSFSGLYVPNHENALKWMKTNTSEGAVVLSWWDYGHEIRGYARRKVVAYSPSRNILWSVSGAWDEGVNGPFSDHEKILDIARALTGSNLSTLSENMRKYSAEYLFTTRFDISTSTFKALLEIAGLNPDNYIANGEFTELGKSTNLHRLWSDNPAAAEDIGKFLSLVYEDQNVRIYRLK